MSLWDIGGALLGGLMGGSDSTQSSSNERTPWAPAQPWLQSNIGSGQTLQNSYQQNPFSQAQLNAYGNSAALTDNFRNTSASLIDQMNGMKQFDRSNPEAKPTQFNFSTPSGAQSGNTSLGFSNPFGMNQQQSQQMQSLLKPQQGGDTAGMAYQGGGNVNDMFHSLQGLINSPMGGQIASLMGNAGLLGGMTQDGSNVPVGYADTSGGGSYNSGYGSNSAGGSPDGYW